MLHLIGVVAAVAVLAIVGYKLGQKVFKVDTKVEDLKRNLIAVSSQLSSLGLKIVPELCTDVVVSDVSGIVDKVKRVLALFAGDPTKLYQEFDNVFEAVLTAKLATDGGRALIAAKLADAAKETDPSVVKDAPSAIVV